MDELTCHVHGVPEFVTARLVFAGHLCRQLQSTRNEGGRRIEHHARRLTSIRALDLGEAQDLRYHISDRERIDRSDV